MNHATPSNTLPGGAAASAAPRQSSPTILWSMLNIEPERPDVGDEIVRHMVAPLCAQVRAWEGSRFGFSRGVEAAYPVVHLHVRATEGVIERAWTFAHALANESAARLGAVKITRSPDIVYPPRPGEPLPEMMEAAFARFGGPAGLKLAAEISELSSDLALWAVNRFPGLPMRSMLAALLLFDTAHAMMRGPRSAVWPDRRATSWDYYWNSHLHACTGSFGSHSEQARRAMLARMGPRIMPAHRMMTALAAEPMVDAWRKRWSRAIDLYLYRADKQRISRSAQQLAMGASRLVLNRMGFPLREEGTLGLYARAWSKEIEEQYSGGEAHPGRK